MQFKDYFSNIATEYAVYRPDYPKALFEYLASLTASHQLAWDCGTGNGQAAVALVDYFDKVIATDPSEQQIKSALHKDNVEYRVMVAEQTNLLEQSVDLITVAQALHWFNFVQFYSEVKRVIKPNGILAAWCYNLLSINPAFDEIILSIYHDLARPYWAAERRFLDEEYETIPFPFPRLATPQFFIEKHWNFQKMVGYINTWSGLRNYTKQHGVNPLEQYIPKLVAAWGNPEETKLIRWPIHLLVAHVE